MADKTTLTDALRIRLLMDNPNKLKLTSWISIEWTNHPLSFYYATEADLDNKIFETMRDILATENKSMSNAVANTLKNKVKLSTKPLDAIQPMIDANDAADDDTSPIDIAEVGE